MSVEVVWDNEEKTIIRYVFSARYSWDEFEVAGRQHIEMIKETSGPVGVILEYPHNVVLPIYALSIGREHVSRRNPRNYLIVVATTSLFLRSMIGLFKRFYPREGDSVMVTQTVAEARSLLAQHRSSNVG